MRSSNQLGKARICKVCDEKKLIEQFFPQVVKQKRYWQHICKDCANKRDRERRAKDPIWREKTNNRRRNDLAYKSRYNEWRRNDLEYKSRANERHRRSREKDPDWKRKANERSSKWRILNQDYQRRRLSNPVHRAKSNRYQRDYKRLGILNMSDTYLKDLLAKGSNLKRASIPQELIEAKRQQLLIIRHLRG